MFRLALLAALLFPALGLADTVIFKNGQELEGKVLEQDDTSILLQVEYGTMRISKDKVERIEPDTPEKLARREAEGKAAPATAAKETAKPGNAQAQLKAKLAEAAKAAEAKAKAKAAAAAQKTAQQPQPSWADQYVQFRRTMHNDQTKKAGKAKDPATSRTRFDRESLLGTAPKGLTGDIRNLLRQ